MIEYQQLAPDLQISRVLTGLWQVADLERDGSTLDPVATAKFMAPYVEAGFTTFDMADHYGSAEIIAGQFKRHEPGGDRVQLLTKWVPEPGPVTLATTREAVQRSLDRMQLQRLDLLQFHGGDAETLQRQGLIDLLEDFRRQGLIRFIGVSSRLPDLPALIELGVFDTFQIPYACLAPEHHQLITQAAVGPVGYADLKDAALEKAVQYTEELAEDSQFSRLQSAHIGVMMRQRISAQPPVEFQELLRPIFREDEWILVAIGGVLGALAGWGQLVLLFGDRLINLP